MVKKKKVVIIGAGPAGLGCAYELVNQENRDYEILILEKNSQVGGLARTHKFKGYNFDVGPHRFFTKNNEVLKLWKDVLKTEFIEVDRLTSILYRNKIFSYPIQLKDVLQKLGVFESVLILNSYLYAKVFLSNKIPKTLEEWVVKNFGRKLFSMFFKTYNEKVWGIPCEKIGAEWAAQRIKNLSVLEVARNALFGDKKRKAKSLVTKFYYPKKGAGQMYDKMAKIAMLKNARIVEDAEVVSVEHRNKGIHSISYKKNGKIINEKVDFLFSSMPLTGFVQSLKNLPDVKVIKSAKKLYYRDHITVNLLVKNSNIFLENWIYVHSTEVFTARVSNYNNFEKNRGKNKKYAPIAVEYFVFQNDKLWKMSDEDLIKFAIKEMEMINLFSADMVIDGFVIREKDSYPTYYMGHKPHYDVLKNYVSDFKNLQLIGRGGMYKYNNMDHAIYSGLLAARNYLARKNIYDVWDINEDADYLEEKK